MVNFFVYIFYFYFILISILGFGFIVPWLLFPLHMFIFAGAMTWKVYKGDWKEIEV